MLVTGALPVRGGGGMPQPHRADNQ